MSKKEENILVIGAVLLATIIAVISIFNRDKPITSEKGKRILSNKTDKKNLLKAIKDGKHSVETNEGVVNIL